MRLRPLLALLLPVAPVSAASLLSIDFEAPAYASGALPGQQSWTGQNAWQVAPEGASGPLVPGGTQSARITTNSAGAERAALAFPALSETVYARVNLRYDDAGAPSNSSFFWFALQKSGGASADDQSLGFVLGYSGTWGLLGRVRTATNTQAPAIAVPFPTNTTHTLILKIEKTGAAGAAYDRLSVWLNPALQTGSTEPATPAITISASSGQSSIDRLFFRIGNTGSLVTGQSVTIDSLLLATDWNDLAVESPGAPASADLATHRTVRASPRDYDGDGIPDLLERGLGTAPLSATSAADAALTLVPGPGRIDLVYRRPTSPGRHLARVETSSDLAAWTSVGIDQAHAVALAPDGRAEVTARAPMSGERAFARIRVQDTQRLDSLTFAAARDLFAGMVSFWSTKLDAHATGDTYGGSWPHEWSMRMLWPLASWLSRPGRPTTLSRNGIAVDVADTLRRALVNGPDPAVATRWPVAANQSSQVVVEAPQAALAALLLQQSVATGAPGGSVWNQLGPAQRTRLNTFLQAASQSGFVYNNNWNLFLVLNHEARRQLSLAGFSEFTFDQGLIHNRLGVVQGLHQGGGWYSDWNSVRVFDDYIPWALLPDQMTWFTLLGDVPESATIIPDTGGRGRARILSDAAAWLRYQILTFDAEGGDPEYGRSSTYKTARLRALITAYVIDRLYNTPSRWNLGFSVLPPEITPGVLRRLIRLHFNRYLENGVIDPVSFEYKDGQTLETSPELIDSYTNKGSRFWAVFPLGLLFQLPDDDPVWSTPEEPLPAETRAYESWWQAPGFLVRHEPSLGHVELFPARNFKNAWMDDGYFNKYTKFAYSSRFGYCTKSGSRLDQSVMIDAGYRQNPSSADYYLRKGRADNEPGVLRTVHAQGAAGIRTLIFLRNGAQVRAHRITGASGKRIRDGAYALGHPAGETPPASLSGPDWIYHESSVGAQLVARLRGYSAVGSLAGSGFHSRQAYWRIPYAEIAAAPSGAFDCAMLIQASASGRFDPVEARAQVSAFDILGDTARVTWSDGATSIAVFP